MSLFILLQLTENTTLVIWCQPFKLVTTAHSVQPHTAAIYIYIFSEKALKSTNHYTDKWQIAGEHLGPEHFAAKEQDIPLRSWWKPTQRPETQLQSKAHFAVC